MWRLAVFVFCALRASFVQSEKVIRVIPKVEAHLKVLRGLERRADVKVDFWKGPSHLFRPVDIEVSDNDFITLSSLLEDDGIEFKVQIDDVEKMIEDEQKSAAVGAKRGGGGNGNGGGGGDGSGSWHGQYHTLDEINSKLNDIEFTYGNLASVISLSHSYEGKDMLAIKISGKYSSNKPVFFIECGIHAREWISPATCMYFIDQMTQKYLKDDSVTAMLDKMDFVILPVFNVDGYSYSWGGRKFRLWRKNRRQHSNCYGVDLNRNWAYGWGGTGASPYECDETYRGSGAFSEVETNNVRSYLEGLHSEGKLKGFIDFHAYSQMWFIPWGYTSKNTPDHAEQMRVARIAAEAITSKYGTKYEYGSAAALLYAAAGGSEDWTYGTLGVTYSFSVELRDTGRYGFLLPANRIIPTGEETFEGLKALVKAMVI